MLGLTTTSGLWLAAAGLGIAAIALGVAALLLRQSRPAPKSSRTPEEATELIRLQALDTFASTLDLNELIRRVLGTTVEACRADAAAIGLRQPAEAAPLIQAYDLSHEELASLTENLEAENDAAMILRYSRERDELSDHRIGTALVVPLDDAYEDHMGNIAALWRRDLGADAEARLAELEAVGKAARTALANAIRFDGVSELSIRDGPSGLFNRRYFLGRLAEEVTRAHRRASLLTLVLFEVSPTSSSAGDPDSSPMLHEVGRRVQSLMSGTETPCRLGGGEFAIVMPDSSISDAEALVERLGDVLDEAQPIGVVIAQLLHEEDHDSLFRRASAALLYSKRRDELHVATAERPASSTAGTART